MTHAHDAQRIPTVRIRDKAVVGGFRIINKDDLKSSDLIIEDSPEKGKSEEAEGE